MKRIRHCAVNTEASLSGPTRQRDPRVLHSRENLSMNESKPVAVLWLSQNHEGVPRCQERKKSGFALSRRPSARHRMWLSKSIPSHTVGKRLNFSFKPQCIERDRISQWLIPGKCDYTLLLVPSGISSVSAHVHVVSHSDDN